MDISQSLLLDGNSLLKTALPDDPLLKGISSYVEEKSPLETRSRSQDSAFFEPMRDELTPLWVEEQENLKAILPFSSASSVTSNSYGSNGNGLVLRSGLGEGQNSTSDSYRVINLGVLPGDSYSRPNDINNLGQVVGYSRNLDGVSDRAFLYSGGQTIDLGTLPEDTYSFASGINDLGQVVGSSSSGAFLYSDGQMTDLGTGSFSVANEINNSGQVVGYFNSSDNSNPHAFLYSNGQMIDLGTLPNRDISHAEDINNFGQVIGFSGSGYNNGTRELDRAFLYINGQKIDLGTPFGDAFDVQVSGINDLGQIVGSSELPPVPNDPNWTVQYIFAFLYSNGQTTALGSLPGDFASHATDINNSGQIVGSSYNGIYADWDDLRAFLYEDGKMTDLNSLIPSDSGWTLREATAINDKGQIVGTGKIGGQERAFLLDPNTTFTATPQDGITVGNISTLGDSIELQGLKITLKGESITTNGGKITLDAPTLLNSPTNEFKFDSTVSVDGGGGGDITFKNTFDGYSAGTQNLTIKAGKGNITFDKAVGSKATLKDFTVNGALTFTANGNITSEGDITLKVIDDIRTANLSTNDTSKIDISLGKVGEQIFDSTGNVTTGSITAKELNVLSDGAFTANGMIEALNGDVNITALRDIAIEKIIATNGTTRLISGLGSITATSEIKSDNGLFALARQNINTDRIQSSQYTIVLNAKQGAITVNGSLAANNSVALTALKDVVAQQITSQDDAVSVVSASGIVKVQGAISGKDDVAIGAAKDVIAQNLTSTFGTVDLGSTQSSIAVSGAISGFDVNLSAKQNVTTSRISSWGDAIALISEQGVVTTNGALATNGGEIYLSSAGSLTSQNVISNGGAINVISSQGSIITGYLRSDKEGLSGGKIYLQAAGRIKVISSVLINDTEYSIYTGNNKKGWIEVAYESGVSKSKKSNFAIKDASINGTIADVSAPPRTLPKPQPIKPGTGRGLIWLEIFRRVLDAGGTAPGHMTEINPITGDRYRDEEQFKLVKKFTPNQSDEIIKYINDSRYFLLIDDVEERGEFGTATDDKGRRCFGIPLTVHLGGDANHNRYATEVTGSEGDYILIPPDAMTIGNIKRYSIIYDGKVQAGSDATLPSPLFSPSFNPNGVEPIGALAEVKTGHDFLTRVFNGNPLPKRLNANGDEIPSDLERLNELVQQVRKEALIARACHRNYFLSFEYSEDVARAAASLINASLASEGISVRVRYIPRF